MFVSRRRLPDPGGLYTIFISVTQNTHAVPFTPWGYLQKKKEKYTGKKNL